MSTPRYKAWIAVCILLLIILIPHHHHHGGSACYVPMAHVGHADPCSDTDTPCSSDTETPDHCVYLKSGLLQVLKSGQSDSGEDYTFHGLIAPFFFAGQSLVPLVNLITDNVISYRFFIPASPAQHFSRRGPPCVG